MSPKEKNKLLKQIFDKTLSKMEWRAYDDTMHQYLVDVNNVYNECCVDLKAHFQQLWIKKTWTRDSKFKVTTVVNTEWRVVAWNEKAATVSKPLTQKAKLAVINDEENMEETFVLALIHSEEKAITREFFLKTTTAQCCVAKRTQWFNDTWNAMETVLKEEWIDINLYIQSLEDAKKDDQSENSQEESASDTQTTWISDEWGAVEKVEWQKGNISGKTKNKKGKVRPVRRRKK